MGISQNGRPPGTQGMLGILRRRFYGAPRRDQLGKLLYPKGPRTQIIGVPLKGLCTKDPNDRALGPKYYNSFGIWVLGPLGVGPTPKKGSISRRSAFPKATA